MICPGLPRLDAERFAKCLALAERGATEGERAAALAAAHRIAARYGLSPGEAATPPVRAAGLTAAPEPPPPAHRFGPPRPRPKWMEPRAATIAEMIGRRLEHDAWLKALRRVEARRPIRRLRAKRQPTSVSAERPAQV